MNRRQFLTGASAMAVASASALPAAPVLTVWEDIVSGRSLDYSGLVAVTRKAFVPRLFVQLHVADWRSFCATGEELG